MSAELAAIFGDAHRGPLATLAGLTPVDVAAVRRHAHREESRGAHGMAGDAYRVAIALSPTDIAAWRGLGRCLRRAGEERAAADVERAATLLAERLR